MQKKWDLTFNLLNMQITSDDMLKHVIQIVSFGDNLYNMFYYVNLQEINSIFPSKKEDNIIWHINICQQPVHSEAKCDYFTVCLQNLEQVKNLMIKSKSHNPTAWLHRLIWTPFTYI